MICDTHEVIKQIPIQQKKLNAIEVIKQMYNSTKNIVFWIWRILVNIIWGFMQGSKILNYHQFHFNATISFPEACRENTISVRKAKCNKILFSFSYQLYCYWGTDNSNGRMKSVLQNRFQFWIRHWKQMEFGFWKPAQLYSGQYIISGTTMKYSLST